MKTLFTLLCLAIVVEQSDAQELYVQGGASASGTNGLALLQVPFGRSSIGAWGWGRFSFPESAHPVAGMGVYGASPDSIIFGGLGLGFDSVFPGLRVGMLIGHHGKRCEIGFFAEHDNTFDGAEQRNDADKKIASIRQLSILIRTGKRTSIGPFLSPNSTGYGGAAKFSFTAGFSVGVAAGHREGTAFLSYTRR